MLFRSDVACSVADREWTVEMRIELEGLGASTGCPPTAARSEDKQPVPPAGDVWAVNFCRMEQRLKEASAWSPVERGFHEPQSFGLLAFER